MNFSSFKNYGPLLLTVAILIALILSFFLNDSFAAFIYETWEVLKTEDHQRISNYFNDFGLWGPLALILFIILQMFLIIFPSWLPMIIAVMAYGFLQGVLISITGVFLASSVGYWIGKKFGEAALTKIVGKKKYEKMDYWVSNYGFWSVVLFRISPFLSNDAISIGAGMLRMNYRKFITATLVGITPLAIAIAYFINETDALETGMYWIGGVGLLGYVVYVYFDHKRRSA